MTDKKLTDQQELFLSLLFDNGGDAAKAAVDAGYKRDSQYWLIKTLKTEIIDHAENILAQSAPKAAHTLVDIMNSTSPQPQAAVKKDAAKEVLDRVGLGRKDRLEVNANVQGGLFIMPAKTDG
jgi:hypothetical protein